MQRHPALHRPIAPSHFRPGQPASADYLDPPGAQPHSPAGSLFHRSLVRDPPFQLAGYILGDERGLQLWLRNLYHLDTHLLVRQLLHLASQDVHARSLAPDHDARSSCGYGHRYLLRKALYLYLGDTSVGHLVSDEFPNLEILMQEIHVLLTFSEPPCPPLLVDSQSEACRVHLPAPP